MFGGQQRGERVGEEHLVRALPVDEGGAVRTCAWAAVATPDGRVHVGGSLAMPLPRPVADRLRAGQELADAVDDLVGTVGTKHAGGAVGVLTRGLLDRQRAYEVLLTYALAPLLAPEFWAYDAPAGSAP